MNQSNSEKRKLKTLINKYRKLLGISSWSIQVLIVDNKIGLAKNKNFKFTNSDTWAEAEPIDINKRKFIIYFTKSSLSNKNLDQIVLHELLHVLLWKSLDLSEEFSKATNEKLKNRLYNKLYKEEHFIIDKFIKAFMGRINLNL